MKMQDSHLAIASVPFQRWGELYALDEVLNTGTVFKDLDLPFFAAADMQASRRVTGEIMKSSREQECSRKMTEIQKVSFVMDDLRLYLDTHPDDPDALAMLKRVVCKRKQMLSEFPAEFYPLTFECMADIYEKDASSMCYCWQEGPAPWEGVCC